jgi:hypothetical protein
MTLHYVHRQLVAGGLLYVLTGISILGMVAGVWGAADGSLDGSTAFGLAIGGIVFFMLPLVFGSLRVEVTDTELRAAFGLFRWPARVIPLSEIESVEAITYRPIRQMGGWGIRGGRIDGEWVQGWTASGNRGVLVTINGEPRGFLVKVRKYLIGTDDADALCRVIQAVLAGEPLDDE